MIVVAALAALIFQNLHDLEQVVQRHPDAANYRALADAYVRAEQYDRASAAFFKAGSLYAKLGDSNAARALHTQGERYETKIDLFYERPLTDQTRKVNDTGARLEPAYGCYVGAFIDREDALDTGFIGNGQSHKDPLAFDQATGKHHAVFFTYLSYGRPFPTRWIAALRRAGAAAQIAWEPRTVSSVRNDNSLRDFADECAESHTPIFLRFAGEMNGDWTVYHGDPEAYKTMFRLVAKVMHERAPNVAMVWCPNDIPENRIADYYPGPESVDWVGVNFYSVIYNDGDRARGAEWRNPADSLRYVYETYSRLHPIMIGEWAATHRSSVDNVERPDFAIDKIGQLYAALPRLYPRVKAVHWLSMNTIEHAMPGRRLNDFSLLDEPTVVAKYKEMVAPSYYLESVSSDPGQAAPIEYSPLTPGATIGGKVKLSVVVKTYEQRPSVIWTVNGDPASPKTEPGPYEVSVDTARLHAKEAIVSVAVKDSKGGLAGRREVVVKVSP
ncbi:MAG TPA: glycosyl hydrolase [Fimbriimonadaceae bacterium]|nr:glycosyl hydrolase [Fimbriimonadaceae bacterium]